MRRAVIVFGCLLALMGMVGQTSTVTTAETVNQPTIQAAEDTIRQILSSQYDSVQTKVSLPERTCGLTLLSLRLEQQKMRLLREDDWFYNPSLYTGLHNSTIGAVINDLITEPTEFNCSNGITRWQMAQTALLLLAMPEYRLNPEDLGFTAQDVEALRKLEAPK
jgi:hypothetical protein